MAVSKINSNFVNGDVFLNEATWSESLSIEHNNLYRNISTYVTLQSRKYYLTQNRFIFIQTNLKANCDVDINEIDMFV